MTYLNATYCPVCNTTHIPTVICTGWQGDSVTVPQSPNVTLTLWPKEWGEYLERIAIALEALAGIETNA